MNAGTRSRPWEAISHLTGGLFFYYEATIMIWDHINHFKRTDAWGDSTRMNGMLLLLLDAIHDVWGEPIIVHCGYSVTGHATDSQHKLGAAVDFHVMSILPFLEQTVALEAILRGLQVQSKVGLGIYPNWGHPGFHLDVRGCYARWGRIGQDYVGWADAVNYVKMKMGTTA